MADGSWEIEHSTCSVENIETGEDARFELPLRQRSWGRGPGRGGVEILSPRFAAGRGKRPLQCRKMVLQSTFNAQHSTPNAEWAKAEGGMRSEESVGLNRRGAEASRRNLQN